MVTDRISTLLVIAVRSLLQARRRTFMLSAALGMVSFLMMILMGLSQGVSDTLLESSTALMTGHVNIGGFYKAKLADAYPMITRVDEIRKVVNETLPDVRLVIDRDRGWGRIISKTGNAWVAIHGVDITEDTALADSLQLAAENEYLPDGADGEGRDQIVGDISRLSEPDTAILFVSQAKRLGVVVNDTLTISSETLGGMVNTYDVRVVAVVRDIGLMSSWSLFVPEQVVRDLYRLNDDTSGVVMIYLDDIERSAEALEELTVALEKAGFVLMERNPTPFWHKFEIVAGEDWLGQKLDLTIWEEEIAFAKLAITVFDTISVFLIAILMVIIIVGITNTTWIAVRERTQEIGTLRAIGMGRGQVLLMFLLEAAILGFVATGVGALAGAGLAGLLNVVEIPINSQAMRAVLMSDELRMAIQPGLMLRAVAIFTFFTTFAALWPALRAARMQPVTAIHRVG